MYIYVYERELNIYEEEEDYLVPEIMCVAAAVAAVMHSCCTYAEYTLCQSVCVCVRVCVSAEGQHRTSLVCVSQRSSQ